MPPKPQAPIDRLMAKVDKQESGCWVFTGGCTPGGYGQLLGATRGSRVYAHRLSYESFVGPIPTGLQIDHLCQNPPCCNPAHLEPVTEAENHRRTAARRTTCPQGHPYIEGNIYWVGGHRVCRRCRIAQTAAYKARKKAQA